jgi:hypothetical protein
VQAKKLALTDPLAKVVPAYPNHNLAARVTIHHLLTHTGGTGDIFGPESGDRREIHGHAIFWLASVRYTCGMTRRQRSPGRSCWESPNGASRESGSDSRIRCRIALDTLSLSKGRAAGTDDSRG